MFISVFFFFTKSYKVVLYNNLCTSPSLYFVFLHPTEVSEQSLSCVILLESKLCKVEDPGCHSVQQSSKLWATEHKGIQAEKYSYYQLYLGDLIKYIWQVFKMHQHQTFAGNYENIHISSSQFKSVTAVILWFLSDKSITVHLQQYESITCQNLILISDCH